MVVRMKAPETGDSSMLKLLKVVRDRAIAQERAPDRATPVEPAQNRLKQLKCQLMSPQKLQNQLMSPQKLQNQLMSPQKSLLMNQRKRRVNNGSIQPSS